MQQRAVPGRAARPPMRRRRQQLDGLRRPRPAPAGRSRRSDHGRSRPAEPAGRPTPDRRTITPSGRSPATRRPGPLGPASAARPARACSTRVHLAPRPDGDPRRASPARLPGLRERDVLGPPAVRARPVPGGQRGRLVEEEQRGPPPGRHHVAPHALRRSGCSRSTASTASGPTPSVRSGRCRQPRLPISRPRPGSATISPVGSTRFCSGTPRHSSRGPTARTAVRPDGRAPARPGIGSGSTGSGAAPGSQAGPGTGAGPCAGRAAPTRVDEQPGQRVGHRVERGLHTRQPPERRPRLLVRERDLQHQAPVGVPPRPVLRAVGDARPRTARGRARPATGPPRTDRGGPRWTTTARTSRLQRTPHDRRRPALSGVVSPTGRTGFRAYVWHD